MSLVNKPPHPQCGRNLYQLGPDQEGPEPLWQEARSAYRGPAHRRGEGRTTSPDYQIPKSRCRLLSAASRKRRQTLDPRGAGDHNRAVRTLEAERGGRKHGAGFTTPPSTRKQVRYGKGGAGNGGKQSPVFVSGDEVKALLETGKWRLFLGRQPHGLSTNRTHRLFVSKHLADRARRAMARPLGHRHTVEAVIHWAGRQGLYSVVRRQRAMIGRPGDFICVPMFAWHRHVNLTDTPALHIASTTGPPVHGHRHRRPMRTSAIPNIGSMPRQGENCAEHPHPGRRRG